MSRVKRGVTKHARHKRVLKLAKGYRASYSKLYRVAKQQTLRSGAYAFAHQKTLDHQNQRCCQNERHFLQPFDGRSPQSKRKRKPQDPC